MNHFYLFVVETAFVTFRLKDERNVLYVTVSIVILVCVNKVSTVIDI